MRNFSIVLLALAVCFAGICCAPDTLPEPPQPPERGEEASGGENGENGGAAKDDDGDTGSKEETMRITITVGGQLFHADLEATETGRAFVAQLPLTLDMSELNGNEKYCYGLPLPRADRYFDKMASGDLILYSVNCVVLFYGPAGGYSYTRIGRLCDTGGLAAALGRGSVAVTFAQE